MIEFTGPILIIRFIDGQLRVFVIPRGMEA
jgi:hypothetical protein